jgi:hypothetical protein
LNRVEGGRSRRPLVIGLVLAALVAAGIVLAVVVSGGDDNGKKSAGTAPTGTTETVTETQTTVTQTETATTKTTQARQRDQQAIEQTVTTFVESSEQGDSQQACSQVAGGAGKQLPGCATAVGIDLRQLPSSDELQIDNVSVSGDRAEAKLSNGSTFTLRQSGGKWKITGFTSST